MAYSKIISSAIKISYLTQLDTYVVGEKGEIIFHEGKTALPDYMPGAENGDIMNFFREMESVNQLYSYVNPWGLFYLGQSILDEQERYYIIIGPYMEVTPNIYSLSRQYKLSNQQRSNFKNIIEEIKILSPEQISSYEAVLQQFEAMKEAETVPFVIYSDKDKGSNKEEKAQKDEESELVEHRYSIEKDFMHAVERGDKEAALERVSSDNVLFFFSKRLPNQPLRSLKNLTIVLNTLLRIAARNGHVPAILIHRISEKFADKIETGESIAAINQIQDRMIIEYCDLVKSNNLKKYSQMTQKVIEHVMNFYDQQIDKIELAKSCDTHPGNLSKRFKSETGMTITTYQQNLRIKQAKHLLKVKNFPIEEIAWTVGYEDASYFGRVFRKITGYSPSVYRNDIGPKEG